MIPAVRLDCLRSGSHAAGCARGEMHSDSGECGEPRIWQVAPLLGGPRLLLGPHPLVDARLFGGPRLLLGPHP